jgi:hypothetical protein
MLQKQVYELRIDAYEAFRIPMISAVFVPPDDTRVDDGRAIV